MAVVGVPKKWDYEADVIIVGGGTAGLAAAIVVAEAGLKATVLELRSVCGGSLGFGGVAGFAIAGTDEQKAAGIEDSSEVFYEDMVNFCGADPEIARAYVDNQLDAYKMLKEHGIKFPGVTSFPGHSRVRCLGWLIGMGPTMVKALEDGARDKDVDILFRHRATRLITDPQTGRVIGLKVIVMDEIKNFKAKRAVVLASGGFGRNREMVAEYAPEMVDAIPYMPEGHLGDGLKMGLAVGAATKAIGFAVTPSLPLCVETHSMLVISLLWWGGIAVNVDGKRFHDESMPEGFYAALMGAGMRQPGGVYWMVYDDNMRRAMTDARLGLEREKPKEYKANNIEELANSAGIDAEGLKETIDKYNSDIDSESYDTVLGRKFQSGRERPLVKIETPPFYAIKCATSITSMKGGLKINACSQVLNQYDEIIPGLYAAGEVAGGLYTKSYMSGVMTSGSMTFGIIAGRNAAKEPAW